VAACLAGLAPRTASIHFPGGTLVGEWTDETVFLSGPAERAYTGSVETGDLLRVWEASR
jgi:diaminopimelate epimerase